MARTANTVEIHRCDECGATWRGDGRSNNIAWGTLHTYRYGAWKGLNLGADFCAPGCLRDHVARVLAHLDSSSVEGTT